MRTASVRHAPRPGRDGFALVLTLLILCLLIIVVVSYLASMSTEQQTADAFNSKARAADAAQAGVDSAEAMLAESFRDFPDSVTAWDTQQTINDGSAPNPYNNVIVGGSGTYNEGTSLYLRAMPTNATVASVSGGTTSAVVADPQSDKVTGPSTTPSPANDSRGNNPNNPQCQNFVLPLISGVPGGRAQLVTNKASILPAMKLTEPDPAKQNWTDLNVRRSSTDIQGAIGSPPGWAGKPAGGTGLGPKPARAYWVNLKGNDGRLTGRYAFWIDDESFRANINYANNAIARKDNAPDGSTGKYPLDPTTSQPYIIRPTDLCLYGPDVATNQSGPLGNFFLNSSGTYLPLDASGSADATSIISTRKAYPGTFFPDPLAFLHSTADTAGGSTFAAPVPDYLRYLTTTQSGTLNLSRHGTQRLNLNTTISTVDYSQPSAATTVGRQVGQLVQAMKFHLPNFGQRFYRLTTSSTPDATTLNSLQVTSTPLISDPASIYYYKVAANIRDYVDGDCQPTMIQSGGTVMPIAPPTGPAEPDPGVNPVLAQGKESAPFLQETVVRFQPKVDPSSGTYTLKVDYYLEFWNMSDRDVYAATQPGNPALPNLHGAFVRITNQQSWKSYAKDKTVTLDGPGGLLNWTNSSGQVVPLVPPNTDYSIDLTNGVFLKGVSQSGTGGPGSTPLGVVFRAGTATVITTDPAYQTYIETGSSYSSDTGISNPATTYYCTQLSGPGGRIYTGKYARSTTTSSDPSHANEGISPNFRNVDQDYETEITLGNPYGYIDSMPYAVAEGGGEVGTTPTSGATTNDYAYGGSLRGNSSPSTSGDPRSNNEQMVLTPFVSGGDADQSRYYNSYHTLGYPNRDSNYVVPDGNAYPWSDYYMFPGTLGKYSALMVNPDQTTSPAVVADAPLASIGQLGDVYDPARLTLATGSPKSAENSRGGGRTFKIGQRDDRSTYDSTGSPNGNNTANHIPASQGWASWRLTDIFSAGPVASGGTNNYGPTQEPIELPGRININGVMRDNGLALSSLFAGFNFQPATSTDPLFHTPPNLAGQALHSNLSGTNGFAKIFTQMKARLDPTLLATGSRSAAPWGPFFERGEFGELEVGGIPIFGKNPAGTSNKSTDLVNSSIDLDRTFDHGREEVFRRLAEMICTRGDTFTVYAVGQSLVQASTSAPVKVNGTQHLRVTFRLVPKQIINSQTGATQDFHPAYSTNADGTISKGFDFTPPVPPTGTVSPETIARFAKPDRYDVQILSTGTY